MPFELGLAVTYRPSTRHEWFVFEEQRHRLMKSLSDLNGTDPHIHDGKPEGVLRALANALVRRRHRPTAAELSAVYRDVRRSATTVRRDLRTRSLFEARSFDELVVAGRISAEKRIPSLRRRRQSRRSEKGAVFEWRSRQRSWKEYRHAEISSRMRSSRRVGPGISSVARGRSPNAQRPAIRAMKSFS
jgi:hypothetical protein